MRDVDLRDRGTLHIKGITSPPPGQSPFRFEPTLKKVTPFVIPSSSTGVTEKQVCKVSFLGPSERLLSRRDFGVTKWSDHRDVAQSLFFIDPFLLGRFDSFGGVMSNN